MEILILVGICILIILIILIICILNKNKIYENNTNRNSCEGLPNTDNDKKILDILNKKYDASDNGLIFRGLENCDDFITQSELDKCIKYEIDGPHEAAYDGKKVSKDQGATTWLSKGMNPYFYPDTGNIVPYNVLLIFNGKLNIKTDNSGCMFIQDANTNGCPDSDPNCGDNNEIAQKYFDSYTSNPDNPNNPKGILCKFNDKKVMYEQYNKYNDLLAEFNYNRKDPFQFKENQQSSFWTSNDISGVDISGGLLAIGYLYSTDNIDPIFGSKKIAEILQKNICKKYNKKIPIVQIYRELKSDCKNLNEEDCKKNKCNWFNNKCNLMQWHKQYKDLVFKDKNNLIDNKFCNKTITGIPCDSKLSKDEVNKYCKEQIKELNNCNMDAFCQNNYCKYS